MSERIFRYLEGLYKSIPLSVYEGLLLVFCLGAALLFVADGRKVGAKRAIILLAGEYVMLVYCSTVFFRKTMEVIGYNFTPLWSYSAIRNGRTDLIPVIIMNVVVFVPIGVLMGLSYSRMKWWMVVLIGIWISLSIEVLQYVLKRGYAEVDDVIHNLLGCLIGFMLVELLRGMWKLCAYLFVSQWGWSCRAAE